MQNSILRVRNLTKVFTSKHWFRKSTYVTAVDHLSFDLGQGEILGFLGVNGSGKTTTIQMLLNVMTTTEGTIEYFGQNLKTHRSTILQHVTHASAYSHLIGSLTVMENLKIFGQLYNLASHELDDRITVLLKQFGLWNLRDRCARHLSAGQTTRVALIRAFLPRPRIVLLDEPTASLDPDIAHEVRCFILERQRADGTSLLFTSHNMDEVAEVCDRVLVLQTGKIIADDTPQRLAAQIATARVWLIVEEAQDVAQVTSYAQQKELCYEITGNTFAIEIAEKHISELLHDLAQLGVHYSGISIDKPHLEDYFMQVAKQSKASQ